MDNKYQWLKERPHLCLYPYEKLDVRMGNNFKTLNVTCCCNLDLSENKDTLNFQLLDQIKQQMAAGLTPKECNRCFKEESNNLISERIRRLIRKDEDFLYNFEKNRDNIEAVQIGILLSRFCNLACRSCGPSSSSTYSKVTGLGLDLPVVELFDSEEIKETFYTLLQQYYDKALKQNCEFIVSLIGGETLIQKGLLECCAGMVQQGLSGNTTLLIASNMTVPFSQQQIEQLKHFKKIKLICSIDSVGDNYNYVRWPATFDKIEKNMQRLLQVNKELDNKIEYFIQPVFSINNIFYINEILDYWCNWAKVNDQNIRLDTINLNEPSILRPEILPDPHRQELISVLLRAKQHEIFAKFTRTNFLYLWLEKLYNTMESDIDPNNINEFAMFLRYTADYDLRSKSNSFELNSRLFDNLSSEHKDLYWHYYNNVDLKKRMFYKWGKTIIDDYVR